MHIDIIFARADIFIPKHRLYYFRIFFEKFINNFSCPIRRAIIRNDNFNIKIHHLIDNALQALCNIFFLIIRHDANGDLGGFISHNFFN